MRVFPMIHLTRVLGIDCLDPGEKGEKDMRRYQVWAVVIGLLLAAGCQNQELLQCQQEKQDLQVQVEKLQTDFEEMKDMYDEMIDIIYTKNKELKKEIQMLQTQIKELKKKIKN